MLCEKDACMQQLGRTVVSRRLAGDLSHKHAAVACGLGNFGLNNLVISPGCAPRIRLVTILTNAELKYDGILEKRAKNQGQAIVISY